MKRELQARSVELHIRDAMLSRAATETMEVRNQLITSEARFNHEALAIRQNTRRTDRELVHLLEDDMARERDEISAFEQRVEKLIIENRDVRMLEMSVARGRDSLISIQASAVSIPNSPSAKADHLIQELRDQLRVKESMTLSTQKTVQDVSKERLDSADEFTEEINEQKRKNILMRNRIFENIRVAEKA